jgi:hypothetical protein
MYREVLNVVNRGIEFYVERNYVLYREELSAV